jgi:two-component system, NarL family, sensor histidine kinase UhpB
VAIAVFRIAQELLTNVARHAAARVVNLHLAVKGGWMELRVRDDGCGIAAAALPKPDSLGLLGIRERAALFGGTLELSQGLKRGTSAVVRVPLGVGSQ